MSTSWSPPPLQNQTSLTARYRTELKGSGCLQSSGHVLETKVSMSPFTNWKILWHSLFKEEFIQVICILVTFSCIHHIKFSCIPLSLFSVHISYMFPIMNVPFPPFPCPLSLPIFPVKSSPWRSFLRKLLHTEVKRYVVHPKSKWKMWIKRERLQLEG